MLNLKQHDSQMLLQADWQALTQNCLDDDQQKYWLLEQGSMTQLLRQECDALTVNLLSLSPATWHDLSQNEREQLTPNEYLVREVVLLGDGVAWLYGRTILPLSKFPVAVEKQVMGLGSTPLGEYLFKQENVHRDALQFAKITTEAQTLLARCSRLWLDDVPMLVSELFLPDAPIYKENR